jgi:opacity protein-like surface antigen
MKKTLYLSAAFLSAFVVSKASAVDTPKIRHFQGLQIGLLAGHDSTSLKIANENGDGIEGLALNGPEAGINLGYGMHFGKFFAGLDAYYIQNWAKGKVVDPASSGEFKNTQSFGVGLRLGMVCNGALPYVGVGWDHAKFKRKENDQEESDKTNGVRLSVGLDMKVASSVIVGVQGYYTIYKAFKDKENLKLKPKSSGFLFKVAYQI